MLKFKLQKIDTRIDNSQTNMTDYTDPYVTYTVQKCRVKLPLSSYQVWKKSVHKHLNVSQYWTYRNFRTISRDFFSQLWTLRLKQRMQLIYGFFSIQGASHPRLFLASFQLTSKRRAAIQTSLCSVLFISKVSKKFVSIFKHSVEWSIHNNF